MSKTIVKPFEEEPLIAPEDEIFPDRRRWTRKECDRMAKIGFLTGRYELIDGEIISKMGANAPHRITLLFIEAWLLKVFGLLFVQTQTSIEVPENARRVNDPVPDAAVTRERATFYAVRNPGPQDILLLVEVSDSTLKSDLNTKARLYARIGIAEYWVADIAARRLHRHRQPTRNGYTEVTIFESEQEISCTARPEARTVVNAFFPPLPELSVTEGE